MNKKFERIEEEEFLNDLEKKENEIRGKKEIEDIQIKDNLSNNSFSETTVTSLSLFIS